MPFLEQNPDRYILQSKKAAYWELSQPNPFFSFRFLNTVKQRRMSFSGIRVSPSGADRVGITRMFTLCVEGTTP